MMCNLISDYIKEDTVEVYKVAAKKISTGEFYSIAMGFKYPGKGTVPIPKKQKRITEDWDSDILDGPCFRNAMVGRTAGFPDIDKALGIARSAQDYLISTKKYIVIIVKMVLSKELMEGDYGNRPVIAGKFIESIKEVKCVI